MAAKYVFDSNIFIGLERRQPRDATRKPHRISAGCSSVWHSRRKEGSGCRAKKRGDES